MRAKNLFSVFLVTIAAFPGCLLLEPPLKDTEAIVRCLPPDVSLDSKATRRGVFFDRTSSVESELVRLGAQIDGDGKLHGKTGKEIRFWRPPLLLVFGRGSKESLDAYVKSLEELEELETRFTVIELVGEMDFDVESFKAGMPAFGERP